jgi:hypothetical protein
MAWTWQYHRAAASDQAGASSEFPGQGEAEAWLGETWRELLDDGVESVTLFEDGRAVYGPMSLAPE